MAKRPKDSMKFQWRPSDLVKGDVVPLPPSPPLPPATSPLKPPR